MNKFKKIIDIDCVRFEKERIVIVLKSKKAICIEVLKQEMDFVLKDMELENIKLSEGEYE